MTITVKEALVGLVMLVGLLLVGQIFNSANVGSADARVVEVQSNQV